ncbi:MAG: YitT family protein [Sedimentibacter sp.]
MENYLKRTGRLLLGLFLYSLGLTLSIQANVGLAPWDAFNMGVTNITGISYGNISILVGIVILVIVAGFLKEKIGMGTILNTILIGLFVDIMQSIHLIPLMTNFFLGILMLLLSQVIVSVASYFYIGAGMGCGPRDTLMVAMGKLFPKIPIGAIRGTIEGTVLFIGFLLGAKVGIGTVIAVFGISFILQYTFKLLKFDIKAVVHENIFETLLNLKAVLVKS